jgi:hypothetical protein
MSSSALAINARTTTPPMNQFTGELFFFLPTLSPFTDCLAPLRYNARRFVDQSLWKPIILRLYAYGPMNRQVSSDFYPDHSVFIQLIPSRRATFIEVVSRLR